MCNRYVSPTQAEIERFWHIGRHNGNDWVTQLAPRRAGPFLRAQPDTSALELVVGQWGLIPWFAESPKLKYSTNNARFEELASKASYKHPWARGQRCIIPAWHFDEPCWETGKNVWWRFSRADAEPWALAGLWNTWTDKACGEIHESYTLLTLNADDHPLMGRMHKPDPALPPDQQDKRSVIALERDEVDAWLRGSLADASALAKAPSMEVLLGAPVTESAGSRDHTLF